MGCMSPVSLDELSIMFISIVILNVFQFGCLIESADYRNFCILQKLQKPIKHILIPSLILNCIHNRNGLKLIKSNF